MNDAKAAVDFYKTTATKEKLPLQMVAADGDLLVGSAGLDTDDMRSGKYADKTPWLVSVWTRPEYRKRGIAATLVKKASLIRLPSAK